MERTEFSKATLQQAAEGISIDYKRVLFRAWQYWFVIVLSLVIALSIAFVHNRYAVRVYPVTASVIVKEVEDVTGGELLYNNALVNFHRNYLNETYILKSYPLIRRVIEELDFDVAFYREGNILTTEVYDELPMRIKPLRSRLQHRISFTFTIVNPIEFELNAADASKRFNFGDSIDFAGFQGVARLKDTSRLKHTIGVPYIFVYTPSETAASRYVGGLNASWAEEGAGVLNLSITGSNTRKELDFMTGLVETYQQLDLERKNEGASRTVEFISNQLRSISDSLKLVERNLELFKSSHTGADLNGESRRLYERVGELEKSKMELLVRNNYYDYLLEYIQNSENLDQIILPSGMGVNDPILNNLLSSMIDIQLELKGNSRPENPLIIEASKKLGEIKKKVTESVRSLKASDKIKIDFVNKQIKIVELEISGLPTTQRTLISIQRNYSLLENLYIYLLQRRSEAAITQASNTSDIVVLNPPKVGGAISPKVKTNYIIAAFSGLFLPILVFILFEFLDTRVQSKEDVERITSIPFIGGIGHKSAIESLAVLSRPKSAIAESFRALRSNLNYFVGKNEKVVVLVTSSISGEGKTFTSLNLASVYALSGRRTLIVGADMRKPKLFEDFNLKNEAGLSNYLAMLADFETICQKTKYENLDLISGGPVPPNPSELLLSDRMGQFIADAKKVYDVVIIDTPPMAIVTDAFILTPHADHTLFMVRQNYTPKNLMKTVEDYYSTGKLKNISIVLNDISRSGPGYGFGYGYGYGYAYGYGYNYEYGYLYGRKKNESGYYEEES